MTLYMLTFDDSVLGGLGGATGCGCGLATLLLLPDPSCTVCVLVWGAAAAAVVWLPAGSGMAETLGWTTGDCLTIEAAVTVTLSTGAEAVTETV